MPIWKRQTVCIKDSDNFRGASDPSQTQKRPDNRKSNQMQIWCTPGHFIPTKSTLLSVVRDINSGNSRIMWKTASQARMCDRNALPSPCPSCAPFTRPAMSTTFRYDGTLLSSTENIVIIIKRLIVLTTVMWLHCLSLLLRVLVVLGLNATLKFIRPSSSSSSSSLAQLNTHISQVPTYCAAIYLRAKLCISNFSV